MNCVNHPDRTVTAYCQNCGKALCAECTRTVQGNVFCEPCLAARIPPGPVIPPRPSAGPSPSLATFLGFIPGVGAMYNGQYIKAIVHVIVFVVFVGLSSHFWFFGLLIAFWVLYQVFDAHQTAVARRDGLPLPDPFGLNELGNSLSGNRPAPPPGMPPIRPGAPPVTPPGPGAAPPPYSGDWAKQFGRQAEAFGQQVEHQARVWGQQAGEWGEQLRQRIVDESTRAAYPPPPPPPPGWGAPPASGFVAGTGYAPPPPGAVPPPMPPEMELERARREPIGAIVLILLGMLFLFNTLGWFSFGWINHGWPWIIVAIAIWLLLRGWGGGCFPRWRAHSVPPPRVTPENHDAGPEPPAGGER